MSEKEQRGLSNECLPSAAEHRAPHRRQPHPYVAVDVVVFALGADGLKALLVKIAQGPLSGAWAFPGGFVGLDESPDAAAAREVHDHTGIRNVHLEQLYTFGGPDRDPRSRVVSVAYIALARGGERAPHHSTKYGEATWFAVRRLPPLAYDHGRIARMALARLRAKLAYTNIVCNLLPPTFTLTELQHTYQAVLARRLDRRNFRRKLLALGLLTRRPGARRGNHRPAALYAFRRRSPIVISIL